MGDSGSERPGVHGRLRYNHDNGFISTTFYNQHVTTDIGDYSARGVDLTGALQLDNTRISLSIFDAKGLGYYGLLIDAADANGTPRDSAGWFTQVTQTFGATKVGLNYGVSEVDLAGIDQLSQVEKQSKLSLGVYHTLWQIFTVSAELSSMEAESHNNESIENEAVSIGFSLSF